MRSAFLSVSCVQESSEVPCGDCFVCGQPFTVYLVCRSPARCPVATVWYVVSWPRPSAPGASMYFTVPGTTVHRKNMDRGSNLICLSFVYNK